MAAAVSLSTGAMNSVLVKLNALLEGKQYSLSRVVVRDLECLKDELTNMNGLLVKMAYLEDGDELVKGWMRQAREMTYDIEDCIDNFAYRHLGFKGSGFLSNLRKLLPRHRIAVQIQELKARVVEATERRTRYRLADATTSAHRAGTVAIDPRLPALFAEAKSLVGMDGPRDMLIKWLTDEHQQQLRVVSIVGIGGVGKTVLAIEVYRYLNQEKGQFQYCAYVSLSCDPDMKKVFQDILSQVSKWDYAKIKEWDDSKLVNTLREFLHDKRYFVIIDDIWSISAWRLIKCALPENNLGSRVMTTTRDMGVAESCCYSNEDYIFKMTSLTNDEARKLFFKRIFGSEDGCPVHLKQVSEEILKQCHGLPFTIISISSLLATKSDTKEQWERVQNSIGLPLGDNDGLTGIRRVLYLSYNDLSLQLRTCLLYLSIFPKDYIIDRDRLVRRWIAEGFINAERGKTLEEVGESYFHELINRSMIQPVGMQYGGQVSACQVHDLILDFIMSLSIEENFITFVGDQNYPVILKDKVRRLCLNYRYQQDIMLPSFITTSHVRSLTIFGPAKEIPDLSDCYVLRVLDLETQLENHYLGNIGSLYQLRYLRLQSTNITKLPKEIGNLQCLETLDLTRTGIRKLPASIHLLIRLTCLLVNNAKLPDGIGKMQALQELSGVAIDFTSSTDSLHGMGQLTKLRVLQLNWWISDTHRDMKKYMDSLVSSVNELNKCNLRSLCIESGDGCSLSFLLDSWSHTHFLQKFVITRYYVPTIPECITSLTCLEYLVISVDQVKEKVLDVLGYLPALLVLRLSTNSTELIIRNSGFQCLKEFDLTYSNSCTGLMFEPGAMPKLKKLRLVFKAQGQSAFGDFGLDIKHLSSLKLVHVEINCRGARASKVKALEAAIRKPTHLLPSHPALEMQRCDEQDMVKDEGEINVEREEEKGHSDGDIHVEHEESVFSTTAEI